MVSKVNNQGLIKSRKTLNMMEQRFMNVDNEKKKFCQIWHPVKGLKYLTFVASEAILINNGETC